MRRTRLDAATKDLDPPFAIVDLDAFDHNAADLARRAAGHPIRVASKSIRVRELVSRALERPGYAGVMCYSLAEALWLSEQNVTEDLLVAYPTADRASLQKLAANETARQRVTIMVDSTEHLDFVDAAIGPHADIRVCLELDVSWRPLPGVHIGPRRSSIHTPQQAKALAAKIVQRHGFKLVGVMAYEGQIAGLGDNPPGQPLRAIGIRLIQSKSGPELVERRTAVVTAVRQVADLEFVNGGGTGSLELTGSDPSVTELAAGSGLFGPTLFDGYQAFKPEPAALFALSVVRKPTKRVATLFAGGYIASGTPTPDRQPSPYLPAGLKTLGLEGAGEVQTPVTGKAAEQLRIGDRVWMRHAKAGELFERFDEVHLVHGDRIERTVPTYRGERRNFG
ncbi:amino acid deaminase/aldolase [Lentzea flaviverrucosa]|uniref:D-serine deaminase, pyridoxal phosphate-dependent n=1 Tax=Lentzea flaviverrucosa TaxID=200379 RepID=A0A1H9XVX9_9PSEU|nr:amino acid deaminase/aldolase [Lentzea flaviverrucosa]RDI18807.1 D-serine deaminase-like pyridoxal phosphate-dependent protein [Lentzea flaviverrucosa]SES49833.1 D-serine deaminase, pyridoxal phosphate-dependent [Lentzea flaviverrucosa]